MNCTEYRINIGKLLIIPDGHRRYAEQNSISYEAAYIQGAERAADLTERCLLNATVSHLSFYPLAAKNFEERNHANLESVFSAMNFFANRLYSFAEELVIKYRGSLQRLPHATQRCYEKLLKRSSSSKHGTMILELLIDYDGVQELFTLTPEQMQWQIAHPYEVIIRTGGALRLSGAPPLECHGADMFSLPVMFPQLQYEDIVTTIAAYRTEEKRRRNNRRQQESRYDSTTSKVFQY